MKRQLSASCWEGEGAESGGRGRRAGGGGGEREDGGLGEREVGGGVERPLFSTAQVDT